MTWHILVLTMVLHVLPHGCLMDSNPPTPMSPFQERCLSRPLVGPRSTKVSCSLVSQANLGLHPPNIWDSNEHETVHLDFFKGFFDAESETHRTRGSRGPSTAEEGRTLTHQDPSEKRDASTGRGWGSTCANVEGRSGKNTAGFQPPIDEP